MDTNCSSVPYSRGRLMVELSRKVSDTESVPRKATTVAGLLNGSCSMESISNEDKQNPVSKKRTESAASLFDSIMNTTAPNLPDQLPDSSEDLMPILSDLVSTYTSDNNLMNEESLLDISANITVPDIISQSVNMVTDGENDVEDHLHFSDSDGDNKNDPDYDPNLTISSSNSDSESDCMEVAAETVSTQPEENRDEGAAIVSGGKRERVRLEYKKIARDRETHPIRNGCNPTTCKKECYSNVSENRRKEIWSSYWQMSYNQRRAWLFGSVDPTSKKCTVGEHVSRRNLTYRYKLKDASGSTYIVCKTFFLTTLGYNKANDKPVLTALRTAPGAVTAERDRRGKHEPANKINRSRIDEHIELFHPSISHYRREHAPLRRYLPSDIKIHDMYGDFKEKNPNFKCSYEVYRSRVKRNRISFTKLGQEECEICEEFQMNKQSHEHSVTEDELKQLLDDDEPIENLNCELCKSWLLHKRAARVSRQHYQSDSDQDPPQDTVIRSVDLQKVIMLPRMPGNKTAIFTRRIVAFHETFAAVGKRSCKQNKRNTISVLWHEGISGRKQEDIVSAFVMALEHDRDAFRVTYWMDNCAGQNKNWCLYSTLVSLVNGPSISATEITLKYFERGHTFMSADSVHHGVEKEMTKQPGGNIYDFNDFIRVVRSSNSGHVDVLCLEPDNIRTWIGGQSAAKLKKSGRPFLSDIVELQVRRGSKLLYYKLNHDDANFQQFDFQKKNFPINRPAPLGNSPCGISEQKKADIVTKLCPLMPENRSEFWHNLHINTSPEEM